MIYKLKFIGVDVHASLCPMIGLIYLRLIGLVGLGLNILDGLGLHWLGFIGLGLRLEGLDLIYLELVGLGRFGYDKQVLDMRCEDGFGYHNDRKLTWLGEWKHMVGHMIDEKVE